MKCHRQRTPQSPATTYYTISSDIRVIDLALLADRAADLGAGQAICAARLGRVPINGGIPGYSSARSPTGLTLVGEQNVQIRNVDHLDLSRT